MWLFTVLKIGPELRDLNAPETIRKTTGEITRETISGQYLKQDIGTQILWSVWLM